MEFACIVMSDGGSEIKAFKQTKGASYCFMLGNTTISMNCSKRGEDVSQILVVSERRNVPSVSLSLLSHGLRPLRVLQRFRQLLVAQRMRRRIYLGLVVNVNPLHHNFLDELGTDNRPRLHDAKGLQVPAQMRKAEGQQRLG